MDGPAHRPSRPHAGELARRGDELTLISRPERQWWRNLPSRPVRVWLAGVPHEASTTVLPPAETSAALNAVYRAATRGKDLGSEELDRRAGKTIALRLVLGPAPPAAPPLRGAVLVRRWAAACVAGELVGFAAPALVGAALAVTGVPPVLALLPMVLAGAVEGAVLGLAQASVLRRALPGVPTRAWLSATAAGAAVAWALGMLPSTVADQVGGAQPAALAAAAVPLGVLMLVTMGGLQSRQLRGHVNHPGR